MSRYIDADILIQDTIQEYARSKQYRDAIIRMVNKSPTVEPKCGEWIFDDPLRADFECSECLERSDICTPFCPNCGADMRGQDDETD